MWRPEDKRPQWKVGTHEMGEGAESTSQRPLRGDHTHPTRFSHGVALLCASQTPPTCVRRQETQSPREGIRISGGT